MSCNCSKTPAPPPDAYVYPDIADACGVSVATEGPVCRETLPSVASPGSTLPATWTDALPDHNGQGVVLLGRIGSKLAKLIGDGFIQLKAGRAFVVRSIALKTTKLYHEWWVPAGVNKRPIIGRPFPFAAHIVGNGTGEFFLIKGLTGEGVTTNSSQYYDKDRELWDTREDADFPLLQRGLAPRITQGEIVAFPALSASGSASDVRQASVLSGSGILILTQQPTIPSSCDCEGCEPQAAVASVASFLAAPDAEGIYKLRVTVDGDGVPAYSWEDDS